MFSWAGSFHHMPEQFKSRYITWGFRVKRLLDRWAAAVARYPDAACPAAEPGATPAPGQQQESSGRRHWTARAGWGARKKPLEAQMLMCSNTTFKIAVCASDARLLIFKYSQASQTCHPRLSSIRTSCEELGGVCVSRKALKSRMHREKRAGLGLVEFVQGLCVFFFPAMIKKTSCSTRGHLLESCLSSISG